MQEKQPVSMKLEKNERWMREQCRDCADIKFRPMKLGGENSLSCLMVYIEVTVDNVMLQNSLLGQLVNRLWEMPREDLKQAVEDNSLGISDVEELFFLEDVRRALLAGNAVLFLDGYDRVWKISSKGYPNKGVSKAETEKVLRGSNEGLSDSVKVNTALIRKRVRSTGLKVKEVFLGERSDTVTALVYMEELAYPGVVEEMERRLRGFAVDGVLDSGVLEQLTEKRWLSPFPQYQTTERPDRAAQAVLNGRVVLLSDNSPEALILPAAFADFMKSSEDSYHRFAIAGFQRAMRYLAMAAALLLSGLYLAVINFHTQILPTHLVLSVAEARRGVPFPSIMEILFMELAFELIREAGIRMPGLLSGTIGIVGGLIIGDAAVSANLVSPITVVVVAASALGAFAIPGEEFSAPFRLLKFGFILAGGFFGMLGIAGGIFLLFGHLAGLTSFGIPYLMPFVAMEAEDQEAERDRIFRSPIWKMRYRPVFARREQRLRLRKKEENHVRGQ